MMTHILVPLDFAESNLKSLEAAKNLAAQTGAKVTLLHVIESIPFLPEAENADLYNQLEAKARENFDQFLSRIEMKNQWESVLVWGKRAERIVTYAESHQIDVIVLSSHLPNWERPLDGIGGVSHQVAVAARCSVFMVK